MILGSCPHRQTGATKSKEGTDEDDRQDRDHKRPHQILFEDDRDLIAIEIERHGYSVWILDRE